MKYIYMLTILLLLIPNIAYAQPFNKEEFKVTNIIEWQKKGYTGKGVTVVVNDRGKVDTSYFKGKVIDSTGTMEDRNIHSTHAQNTVQIIHQIAPDATIYLSDEDNGGVDYALQLALNKNAQIVNRSMTALDSHISSNLNKKSYDNNIFLNGSSGNSRDSIEAYANNPYWFTTGAAEYYQGKISRAHYSSYGQGIDIMGITGFLVYGKLGYEKSAVYYHGTSASTPFVSGMLALYYQYFKDVNSRFPTVSEARNFVYNNTIDLEDEGYDIYTGHGLFVLPKLNRQANKCIPKTIKNNDKATRMINPKGDIRIVHIDYVSEMIKEEGYRVLECY